MRVKVRVRVRVRVPPHGHAGHFSLYARTLPAIRAEVSGRSRVRLRPGQGLGMGN